MSETLQKPVEKRIAVDNDVRLYRCDPRGIGNGWGKCFHCGKGDDKFCCPDMAMFVPSRETGEAILKLFKYPQYLDYRAYEPRRIQVKLTACEEHKDLLIQLGNDIMATQDRLDGPGIALSMLHPQAQGI